MSEYKMSWTRKAISVRKTILMLLGSTSGDPSTAIGNAPSLKDYSSTHGYHGDLLWKVENQHGTSDYTLPELEEMRQHFNALYFIIPDYALKCGIDLNRKSSDISSRLPPTTEHVQIATSLCSRFIDDLISAIRSKETKK